MRTFIWKSTRCWISLPVTRWLALHCYTLRDICLEGAIGFIKTHYANCSTENIILMRIQRCIFIRKIYGNACYGTCRKQPLAPYERNGQSICRNYIILLLLLYSIIDNIVTLLRRNLLLSSFFLNIFLGYISYIYVAICWQYIANNENRDKWCVSLVFIIFNLSFLIIIFICYFIYIYIILNYILYYSYYLNSIETVYV